MNHPFPNILGAPAGRRHAKLSFWSLIATTAATMMATSASFAFGEEALQIESIVCEGNEKATCDFIQSKTALKAGDPVDDEKVKEAALRLNLIGYFKDTEIRLGKGSRPGFAVLTIKVQERSNLTFNASTGAMKAGSRPFAYMADVTGSHKNLTGAGDVLSLRARGAYRPHRYGGGTHEGVVRAEYFRPSFLTPRLYLLGGITSEKMLGDSGYRDSFSSADIALGYRIFDYSFLALGYRRTTDFDYYNKSSLFVRAGWDSQDSATFPTQGSRFLIGFERYWYHGLTRGWSGLSITSLAFIKHWTIGQSQVLTFRAGVFDEHDPSIDVMEDQAISLRYTRILKRHSDGETLKTALYAEPGLFFGLRERAIRGAKVGANIQTKHGLVNLFFVGGFQ